MQVNNQEFDINKILQEIDVEPLFLHDLGNGILLNDKHISILEKYKINYKKYNNINSLLFDIDLYLNEDDSDDASDLEWVATDLAERNYYQNTKK